jgi:hypothetical protein
VRTKVEIDLSGPFFKRDVKKTVKGNIRRMHQGLADEGERTVKSLYPVLTGAGQAGVVGRVQSLRGRSWMANTVISQTHVYPWPGAGSRQYRGGKTEARHRMFRRATTALRRSRKILAANLVEGLE